MSCEPRKGGWPEDRVIELRRLVTDGSLSLAAMGRVLGVSRGAVALKICRLGLVWVPPAKGAVERHAVKKSPANPLPPVFRADGTPVMLADVTDGECRFPHGDVYDGHLRLCGRKTKPGSPYCNGHHRDAFRRQKASFSNLAGKGGRHE